MDYLATGVLRGPHGIHGFIKLHAYSDEYEHLSDMGVVSLRKDGKEKDFTIESIKPLGREVLIKFVGIDTPESARVYNGWEIWVPRDAAAPLEKDEFYAADLATCSLVVDQKTVGKVVGLIDGPQALLLEVESASDGKRYLVPFMRQYIGTVDIMKQELELLAPELLS